MKYYYFGLTLLVLKGLFCLPLLAQQKSLQFIENKGQWQNDVQFRAEVPGGYLFLKPQGLEYVFYDKSTLPQGHAAPRKDGQTLRGHGLAMRFVGANLQAPLKASDANTTQYNYYLGKNPEKWASQVKAYRNVHYQNIYEGIDLKFYQKANTLKYEFILAAGADPAQILMQYEGASKLSLEAGKLRVTSTVNEFWEQAPYCYQIIKDEVIEVPSHFVLEGKQLSFAFPKGYNPNYPLVIDPELVFSTYSGANFDNWGFTATPDAEGHLYSGGILFDAAQSNGTVTIGPFSATSQGQSDVVILKYSPDGSALLYATFLGGDVVELPHSMIFDDNNNELLIFGTTGSENYPVTEGAFQSTFAGGTGISVSGNTYSNGSDMFISKLAADGSLVASTFIGGAGNDGINAFIPMNYGDECRGDIQVDTNGDIYLVSSTDSEDFPLLNAYQSVKNNGQEAVVLKMNSSLTALEWSTYLGGAASDAGFGITLSSDNRVYVCGASTSSSLPLPSSPIAPLFATNQGQDDGFVARYSNTGQLERLTFLGTTARDQAFLLDFDEEDNLYIFGQTFGNYPVFTPETSIYENANSGQFLQKLDPNLSTNLLSTVVGTGSGSPDISPTAFLVNECGNLYLTGWGGLTNRGRIPASTTAGLPITADAEQSTTDGSDFYVMILEKNGRSLLYATFFGEDNGVTGESFTGDHVDGGTCRFDPQGIIYHAVCASCRGYDAFPTTPGAWSNENNSSNCNNAAFKFDIGSLTAPFDILDADLGIQVQNACEFPLEVVFDYTGQGATTWEWQVDGVVIGNTESITHLFPSNGIYEISLTVGNPASCLEELTVTRDFPISAVELTGGSPDATICAGENLPLNVTFDFAKSDPADPDPTITWQPSLGLSNPNIANPVASPTQTTQYIVTIEDINGCAVSDTVNVEVIPDLSDELNNVFIEMEELCDPVTLNLNYTGDLADNWTWELSGQPSFNDRQGSFELGIGTYTVTFTAERLTPCPQTFVVDSTFTITDIMLSLPPTAEICATDEVELNPTVSGDPAVSYQWTPSEGLSADNIANPIANPQETTTYTLVVQNADGCEAQASITIEVESEITPDFDINISSDCGQPTVVEFDNRTEGTENFVWDMGNGVTLNGRNPEPYIYPEKGIYNINLQALGSLCQAEEMREVIIEDNLSLPPNTISPNGDAQNQRFVISPEREGYKLEVYNRWGNLIYQSDNYQDEWGDNAEVGLYYYLLTSPQGVKCKGWIKVIR